MFGNLKEFISVVQEGLTSNNNLKNTLQEVQKVTNIFRDRQKVSTEANVNYGAGGALLEKYQDQWAELHENADTNARRADDVDKLITELCECTQKRLSSANKMGQVLSHLPNLTVSVAQCMESLKNVQQLLELVENDLVDFEDLVERSKMENWKLDHHYHLSLYKEKKMVALENIRSELTKKNTEESTAREKQQLADLQARRENSSLAFQHDMAKYLSSGNVSSGKPSTSQITLEQVQLDDDRLDLEEFLGS